MVSSSAQAVGQRGLLVEGGIGDLLQHGRRGACAVVNCRPDGTRGSCSLLAHPRARCWSPRAPWPPSRYSS